MIDFNAPDALSQLNHMTGADLDRLPYGVVAMAPDGVVEHYNQAESAFSGLPPERVIGRNFFTEVAPCTNNFMVADKMRDAAELDEIVPYSFSVRMRPTAVTLRLLRSASARRMFMLVRWTAAQ